MVADSSHKVPKSAEFVEDSTDSESTGDPKAFSSQLPTLHSVKTQEKYGRSLHLVPRLAEESTDGDSSDSKPFSSLHPSLQCVKTQDKHDSSAKDKEKKKCKKKKQKVSEKIKGYQSDNIMTAIDHRSDDNWRSGLESQIINSSVPSQTSHPGVNDSVSIQGLKEALDVLNAVSSIPHTEGPYSLLVEATETRNTSAYKNGDVGLVKPKESLRDVTESNRSRLEEKITGDNKHQDRESGKRAKHKDRDSKHPKNKKIEDKSKHKEKGRHKSTKEKKVNHKKHKSKREDKKVVVSDSSEDEAAQERPRLKPKTKEPSTKSLQISSNIKDNKKVEKVVKPLPTSTAGTFNIANYLFREQKPDLLKKSKGVTKPQTSSTKLSTKTDVPDDIKKKDFGSFKIPHGRVATLKDEGNKTPQYISPLQRNNRYNDNNYLEAFKAYNEDAFNEMVGGSPFNASPPESSLFAKPTKSKQAASDYVCDRDLPLEPHQHKKVDYQPTADDNTQQSDISVASSRSSAMSDSSLSIPSWVGGAITETSSPSTPTSNHSGVNSKMVFGLLSAQHANLPRLARFSLNLPPRPVAKISPHAVVASSESVTKLSEQDTSAVESTVVTRGEGDEQSLEDRGMVRFRPEELKNVVDIVMVSPTNSASHPPHQSQQSALDNTADSLYPDSNTSSSLHPVSQAMDMQTKVQRQEVEYYSQLGRQSNWRDPRVVRHLCQQPQLLDEVAKMSPQARVQTDEMQAQVNIWNLQMADNNRWNQSMHVDPEKARKFANWEQEATFSELEETDYSETETELDTEAFEDGNDFGLDDLDREIIYGLHGDKTRRNTYSPYSPTLPARILLASPQNSSGNRAHSPLLEIQQETTNQHDKVSVATPVGFYKELKAESETVNRLEKDTLKKKDSPKNFEKTMNKKVSQVSVPAEKDGSMNSKKRDMSEDRRAIATDETSTHVEREDTVKVGNRMRMEELEEGEIRSSDERSITPPSDHINERVITPPGGILDVQETKPGSFEDSGELSGSLGEEKNAVANSSAVEDGDILEIDAPDDAGFSSDADVNVESEECGQNIESGDEENPVMDQDDDQDDVDHDHNDDQDNDGQDDDEDDNDQDDDNDQVDDEDHDDQDDVMSLFAPSVDSQIDRMSMISRKVSTSGYKQMLPPRIPQAKYPPTHASRIPEPRPPQYPPLPPPPQPQLPPNTPKYIEDLGAPSVLADFLKNTKPEEIRKYTSLEEVKAVISAREASLPPLTEEVVDLTLDEEAGNPVVGYAQRDSTNISLVCCPATRMFSCTIWWQGSRLMIDHLFFT